MPVVIPYPPTNGSIADGTQIQADFNALVAAVNTAFLRDGTVPMGGAIPMNGYGINGLADPVLAQDAATKNWVVAQAYLTSGSLSAYVTTTQLNNALLPYAGINNPNFTGVPKSNGFEIGFRDIPINTQGVYTLALTDRGGAVLTSGTITVPANASIAFPVGSVITIINSTASPQSIAITTDTMTLAGTALSGTRTLAQSGIATLVKVGTTFWVISGNVT